MSVVAVFYIEWYVDSYAAEQSLVDCLPCTPTCMHQYMRLLGNCMLCIRIYGIDVHNSILRMSKHHQCEFCSLLGVNQVIAVSKGTFDGRHLPRS